VTFPGAALPVSAAEASSEGQGHGKRYLRLTEQKAEITAIRISQFVQIEECDFSSRTRPRCQVFFFGAPGASNHKGRQPPPLPKKL